MPAPRLEPFVFPIPGGRLFVIGDDSNSVRARQGEIYDPSADSWSSAGSPAGSHDRELSAAQLADGRILVVGGYESAAADLWDPATGAWTALPATSGTKRYSFVISLADGRALVVGSDGYQRSAEIFDPATLTWAPLALDPFPYPSRGAQLGDGRVLLTSGSKTALWDPSSNVWTAAPAYPEPVFDHGVNYGPAVMAVSGGVLVAVAGMGPGMDRRTFKFDAPGNAWVEIGNLHEDRTYGSSLATLPDGSVLVVGGCCSNTAGMNYGAPRSAEILDLATGTWSPTAALSLHRSRMGLAVVGGRAVALGGAIHASTGYGSTPSAAVEIFDPSVASVGPDLTLSATAFTPSYGSLPGHKYVHAIGFDRSTYIATAGVAVRMEVMPGGPTPAGTLLTCTPSCVFDDYGHVTGAFENNRAAGTDTVRVHVDVNGNGVIDAAEPTATTTHSWAVRTTRLSVEPRSVVDLKPLFIARLEWLYGQTCGGYIYTCSDAYTGVRGRRVNFYYAGSSTPFCSAATNANGVAACGTVVDKLLAINAGGVRAEFVGDALYTASAASGPG